MSIILLSLVVMAGWQGNIPIFASGMHNDNGWRSNDDAEDVVVDIVAAVSVGQDVEHLCESELIGAVHLQVSIDADDDAALNGALLHVRVHVGVLDLLEAERLDLLGDFLEAAVGAAGVGHQTDLAVEVSEVHAGLAVLLHHAEVLLEENVGHLLHVHL